jgi:hypothetical protein
VILSGVNSHVEREKRTKQTDEGWNPMEDPVQLTVTMTDEEVRCPGLADVGGRNVIK